MAEAEQKHRHWKENFAIVIRSINSVLGMLFGVAIVVLCLWLAYKLATNGHDWLAGSVIAITTGCATVFVIRRAPSKEK